MTPPNARAEKNAPTTSAASPRLPSAFNGRNESNRAMPPAKTMATKPNTTTGYERSSLISGAPGGLRQSSGSAAARSAACCCWSLLACTIHYSIGEACKEGVGGNALKSPYPKSGRSDGGELRNQEVARRAGLGVLEKPYDARAPQSVPTTPYAFTGSKLNAHRRRQTASRSFAKSFIVLPTKTRSLRLICGSVMFWVIASA